MNKKSSKINVAAILLSTAVLLPCFALAVPTSFKDVIQEILDVINRLVQLIMVLALLFFVWNIFKLVFAGGNEESIKEARTFMIYGVIALFVMVSVWGLVNILSSTFFGGSFVVPQLK